VKVWVTTLITGLLLASALAVPASALDINTLAMIGGRETALISVDFHFDDPLATWNGAEASVRVEGLDVLERPGYPVVPMRPARVLLPPNARVNEVLALPGEEAILQGTFELEVAGYPVPNDEEGSAPMTEAAAEGTYPEEPFDSKGVQLYRGYSILMVNLFPVRYSHQTGEVRYCNDITLVVRCEFDSRNAPELYRGLDGDSALVREMVENPDDEVRYASLDMQQKRTVSLSEDDVEHVIICNASFAPGFQALADWREQNGMSSRVVILEDIVANGTGNDTQEKVRNFIIDAYTDWNTNYVLLGGDDECIPHRGLFWTVRTSQGPINDLDIPADIYYAGLDGTWNDKQDTPSSAKRWGEAEEADLYAEIAVGRAAVSGTEEVSVFVDKVIGYENRTDSRYQDRVVAIAALLSDSVDGMEISERVLENVPDTYRLVRNYQTLETSSIPEIKESLYGGANLGMFVGHGNSNNIMTYLDTSENGANVYMDYHAMTSIDNAPKYNIFYSQACYNGAFDNLQSGGEPNPDGDAISERMVTQDDGGSVAFIGNSRYGFHDGTETHGSSARFNYQFYEALFIDNMTRVGDAFNKSKLDLAHMAEDVEGQYRWVYYNLNLLGDPAMDFQRYVPEPHDVVVESVESPELMPTGETAVVRGTVFNDGTEDEEIFEVNLLVDEVPVDSIPIGFLQSKERMDVEFYWTPDSDGYHSINLSIEPLEGETIVSNNHMTVWSYSITIGDAMVIRDDGLSGDYPNDALITETLEGMGYTCDVWNVSDGVPSPDWLNMYEVVIWTAGEAGTGCLSGADADAITQYVEDGGNLFMEGAGIAEQHRDDDLMETLFGAIPSGRFPNDGYVFMRKFVNNGFTFNMDELIHLDEPGQSMAFEVLEPVGDAIPLYEFVEGFDLDIPAANSALVLNRGDIISGMGDAMYLGTNLAGLPERDIEELLFGFMALHIPFQHELAIIEVGLPRIVGLGENVSTNVTIRNYGLNREDGLFASMTIHDSDGDFVACIYKPVDVLAGETCTISFNWNTPGTRDDYLVTFDIWPGGGEAYPDNNRARRQLAVRPVAGDFNVLVLDSYGSDHPYRTVWPHVNDEWMRYGDYAIEVNSIGGDENVTHDMLNDSGADILVISNAYSKDAGWAFTESEQAAIMDYVSRGHGLLATAGSLSKYVADTKELANCFGLSTLKWGDWPVDVAAPMNVSDPDGLLFDPGTTSVMMGSTVTLSNIAIVGAETELLAWEEASGAFIVADHWVDGRTMYISTLIEDVLTGPVDLPVLYNALVYLGQSQNLPPVQIAELPELMMDEDTGTPAILQLNDFFNDTRALTFTLAPFQNATTTVDGDGMLSVLPAQDWYGNETTGIEISDGELGIYAELTIDVRPVNDLPEVVGPFPELALMEDDPMAELLDLDCFFRDVDSELGYSFSTEAQFTVALGSDGHTLFGSPEPAWSGFVNVTVFASDIEASVNQTLTIFVEHRNRPTLPVGSMEPITLDEDCNWTEVLCTADYFSDEDSTLTFAAEGSEHISAWLDEDGATWVRPADDWFGTEIIHFTATDGEFTAFQNVTVTIVNVDDPTVQLAPLPDVELQEDQGMTYAFKVDEYFMDIDSMLDYTAITMPGVELALDANARLWITPDDDWFGSQMAGIRVSDGVASFVAHFNIIVSPVNDAPTIEESIPDQVELEDCGAVRVVNLGSAFEDIDSVLEYALAPSQHIQLWIGAQGWLWARPDAEWSGFEWLTIEARDDEYSVNQTFGFTALFVNDPPVVLEPIAPVTTHEDCGWFRLMRLDSHFGDIDSELTVTMPDSSFFDIVLDEEGYVLLRPLDEWSGSETLEFTAMDEASQVVDGIVVNVLPVNDPPQVSSPIPDFAAPEDGGAVRVVRMPAHFSDIDSELSFSWTGGSQLGLYMGYDGWIWLLSPANWSGSELVEFSAFDGEFNITCTARITVEPVNDPPLQLAPLPDIYLEEDGTLGDALDLSAYFADADSLLAYSVKGAVNVHLTVRDDGSVEVHLTENWHGTELLELVVSDQYTSITAPLRVVVSSVADPPVWMDVDDVELVEDEPADGVLYLPSIISDPDTPTKDITFSISFLDERIGAVISDGSLDVTWLEQDFNGAVMLGIDADDGTHTASLYIVLNVLAVNDAPTAVISSPSDGVAVGKNLALRFASAGSGDPEGRISFLWNMGDGTELEGGAPVHAYAASGTYEVTLVVTDGDGETSSASMTVEVSNAAPVITSSDIPSELTIPDGGVWSFSPSVTDADGDALTFLWILDGEPAGDARTFVYSAEDAVLGEHVLTLRVDDGEASGVVTFKFVVAPGKETGVEYGEGGSAPPGAAAATTIALPLMLAVMLAAGIFVAGRVRARSNAIRFPGGQMVTCPCGAVFNTRHGMAQCPSCGARGKVS